MKYWMIVIFAGLISCQSSQEVKVKGKDSIPGTEDTLSQHIVDWCMFRRVGYQGDTILHTRNRIIIQDDSLITYMINDSVVYREVQYRPVHYSPGKVVKGYDIPRIAIDDPTDVLIHYPGGQDGGQEFYKRCQ